MVTRDKHKKSSRELGYYGPNPSDLTPGALMLVLIPCIVVGIIVLLSSV